MKQKPSRDELKQILSAEQFRITQDNGTEPPFQNAYWDNTRPGIYVDVVSGKPLFSSTHQYDAGCGWPSFTQPLSDDVLNFRKDRSNSMIRTEVRSTEADSHLGHVFTDGPEIAGGLRYCINSAALRFVPKEDLEKEGFGHLSHLFQD